jgi:large subunit ribosomal protein L4
MELTVLAVDEGRLNGTLQVADTAFAARFNEPLVHQVVTAYLAAGRAGTRAQKSRSDVSGGGSKPWRQKGTGRARAGTTRSPLWRSGGVTFAATPVSYEQKVNRKMYRAAMRGIVSELVRQERLVLVEDMSPPTHKTKDLLAVLRRFGVEDVLIVVDQPNENLRRAAGNIPNVDVCEVAAVNPVNLMQFDAVLMTGSAAKALEERLA